MQLLTKRNEITACQADVSVYIDLSVLSGLCYISVNFECVSCLTSLATRSAIVCEYSRIRADRNI